MARDEDILDMVDDDIINQKPFNKKKFLIFILPVLIVIGLVVSFITVFSQKTNSDGANYDVVTQSITDGSGSTEKVTVLYTLPELTGRLRTSSGTPETVKLKINIELSSVDDIKTVEKLQPRINDTLLSHLVELTPDEISGSDGLYWLKEEMLYRVNLILAPIKVSNLNIKTLDIQKNN